jgi:hypothetical protein
MAITHSATQRNAFADSVLAGSVSGSIKLYTAGNTLLVSIPLTSTPWTRTATGVLTFNPPAGTTSAAASGTVTKYTIFASNGTTEVISGTVTNLAGNGDMKINSVTIEVGDLVRVVSGTYTASP